MDHLEYWKKRCELAEMYIEECPCDPDITLSQLAAYSAWNHFKSIEKPKKEECKHSEYTCYYGKEGELMESRCDNCGEDISS